MDSPDHVPEKCLAKGDESQARNTDELFHQCIQFQRALLYQKICYIGRASDITNGHVGKCLGGRILSAEEGWALPQIRLDTVLGSGLPKCSYCGQVRPLHYPGDCDWALYSTNRALCLVCRDDGHVPEECKILGTSVLGRETYADMIDAYLTKQSNKGQCYICKAYHLEGGKYSDKHYPSKICLHSLLTKGKVRWDRKESLLERSKEHHRVLNLPEPETERSRWEAHHEETP